MTAIAVVLAVSKRIIQQEEERDFFAPAHNTSETVWSIVCYFKLFNIIKTLTN